MMLSLISFDMAASTRLKGGNVYIYEMYMSFPTEIKSIHCNAIWVWHSRDIFAYLFVETGDKEIDLWIKLKPETQNCKQFVGQHLFCVVTEDSRHFFCHFFLYTRNVA